jgi:hypothetical protein
MSDDPIQLEIRREPAAAQLKGFQEWEKEPHVAACPCNVLYVESPTSDREVS